MAGYATIKKNSTVESKDSVSETKAATWRVYTEELRIVTRLRGTSLTTSAEKVSAEKNKVTTTHRSYQHKQQNREPRNQWQTNTLTWQKFLSLLQKIDKSFWVSIVRIFLWVVSAAQHLPIAGQLSEPPETKWIVIPPQCGNHPPSVVFLSWPANIDDVLVNQRTNQTPFISHWQTFFRGRDNTAGLPFVVRRSISFKQ